MGLIGMWNETVSVIPGTGWHPHFLLPWPLQLWTAELLLFHLAVEIMKVQIPSWLLKNPSPLSHLLMSCLCTSQEHSKEDWNFRDSHSVRISRIPGQSHITEHLFIDSVGESRRRNQRTKQSENCG